MSSLNKQVCKEIAILNPRVRTDITYKDISAWNDTTPEIETFHIDENGNKIIKKINILEGLMLSNPDAISISHTNQISASTSETTLSPSSIL